MHEANANSQHDELMAQVRALHEPWCDFSLGEARRYDINGAEDYDAHGVVRELVYRTHGEEASISKGKLPVVLSPMLWETFRGDARDEIASPEDQAVPISEARFERYQRLLRMWRGISKVFPVDPEAYEGSLTKSYARNRFTATQQLRDIDRRIGGLRVLRGSIEAGQWPRMIVVVPATGDYRRMIRSYTITPHMEAEVIRGEGRVGHYGWLYYSPRTNRILRASWNDRWNDVLGYTCGRDDWPEELRDINDMPLFEEQLTFFNVRSVDLIIERLEGMRRKIEALLPPVPPAEAASFIEAHRFRVALSYPGEARDVVKRVAQGLAEHLGKRAVFYDRFYEADLLRPGMDTLLQDIYRNRSDLIVPFVGKDYQRKEWCGLEWRAIRQLIRERQFDRILLVRMDDEPVDGIYGGDGYIDARERSPDEIVDLIGRRLEGLGGDGE